MVSAMKRFVLLIGLLPAVASAQQPTQVEVLLQQSIGTCVGNNARLAVDLDAANRRIKELEGQVEKNPLPAPGSESGPG